MIKWYCAPAHTIPTFFGREELQAAVLVHKAVDIVGRGGRCRAGRVVRHGLAQLIVVGIIHKSDRALVHHRNGLRQVQVVVCNAGNGLVQVFGQVAAAVISIIDVTAMAVLVIQGCFIFSIYSLRQRIYYFSSTVH